MPHPERNQRLRSNLRHRGADKMRVRYLPSPKRSVPVGLIEWHPAMLMCHETVDHTFLEVIGREAILTGAQEDAHSRGSLHFGLAPDIRCRAADYSDDGVTKPQRVRIKSRLAWRLGKNFDIVWEKYHLHIEYQPKPWDRIKP